MLQLSDEELVAKYREHAGSPSADNWINELFRRYQSKVATWCYRFTGDRESATDLAQDIFLRAYRNLHSFRGDSRFSTWLFTIARNHCMNEMKARSVRPVTANDDLALDLEPAREESVLAALENEEARNSMRSLIEETLDETEKQVMTLHYGEEITLDVISRLLGLTNTTGAKAFIVSARRKLVAAAQRRSARG